MRRDRLLCAELPLSRPATSVSRRNQLQLAADQACNATRSTSLRRITVSQASHKRIPEKSTATLRGSSLQCDEIDFSTPNYRYPGQPQAYPGEINCNSPRIKPAMRRDRLLYAELPLSRPATSVSRRN